MSSQTSSPPEDDLYMLQPGQPGYAPPTKSPHPAARNEDFVIPYQHNLDPSVQQQHMGDSKVSHVLAVLFSRRLLLRNGSIFSPKTWREHH